MAEESGGVLLSVEECDRGRCLFSDLWIVHLFSFQKHASFIFEQQVHSLSSYNFFNQSFKV